MCSASVSDDDGETPSLSYAWTLPDGTQIEGDSYVIDGLSHGDEIIAQRLVKTTTVADTDNTSVTIENSTPTVDSISLNPDPPDRQHHPSPVSTLTLTTTA